MPDGTYQVTLHFADIYRATHAIGARVFDVMMEGFGVFKDVDIFSEVGGFAPLTRSAPVSVSDGALTIEFLTVKENPKISAIAVEASQSVKAHHAHAGAGGPYYQYDTDGNNVASVEVDGTFSHSHGNGARLVSWKWKVNNTVVGTGEVTTLELPVGVHELVLVVTDNDGAVSKDFTSVTIWSSEYADITSLSTASSDVAGGGKIIITGSGFTAPVDFTTVHFGSKALSGPSEITIINDKMIEVGSVPKGAAGKVQVTVETPIGVSSAVPFTYTDGTPLAFTSGILFNETHGPTCVAVGPDGRIYIGTQTGSIVRLTLNERHEVLDSFTSYAVISSDTKFRSILGITFDPMDTSPNPTVYVSHSTLFHGELVSNNGKVSAISGANLDQIRHIVTGLPVSDLDHAVNGIEFGDRGELYIQVGGNTNAGVPGPLSSSGKQKDGLLSASTLVAHLSRPGYDCNVMYDSNGDQISGFDVEVFAYGQHNSFDITLHSNGNLYATDNGPNFGFGKRSLNCLEDGMDPNESDELNLIVRGAYYGHANRKRGENDPRQCLWRSADEASDDEYTAPLTMLPSSTNGMIEFQTLHFGSKLRGQLILGRYKGALYHVALSADGKSVLNKVPSELVKKGGIGVAQGPDGTLYAASVFAGEVVYHAPYEAPSLDLTVKSVFPRRGLNKGGSLLTLYGENLNTFGNPTVTVGGQACPVMGPISASTIKCTLPAGAGKADVVVTSGAQTATFNAAISLHNWSLVSLTAGTAIFSSKTLTTLKHFVKQT